ncbi:hypothetical protein [Longispora urticae]
MRTLRVLTIAGLAALALAACGAEPSASPTADTQVTTSPSASAQPSPSATGQATANPPKVPNTTDAVTLVRTGGFAGVRDTWTIQPDGSWASDNRSAQKKSGKLTDAQRTELTGLLKDPVLVKELKTPGTAKCADTFSYTLTFGQESYTVENCGEPRPTFGKLVGLVQGLTGS